MIRRIKVSWHKARALSAAQTYLEVPPKEPLPLVLNAQLVQLSERGVEEAVSPIDTAFRFYAQLAAEHVSNGGSLDSIGFFESLGRLTALRNQLLRYQEHHTALVAISKYEDSLKS